MRPFDRSAFRKALDNRTEGQKDAAASMIFQSLMRQPLFLKRLMRKMGLEQNTNFKNPHRKELSGH